MGIWDFVQDEILGMKWLNRLIGSVLNAFGLDTSGKIGGSVHFFIYDVIKIMVLLGTVTPFCSCSSIPLFIGFTSAGLPLGVTFSFLISSRMIDLGSLILLMSKRSWNTVQCQCLRLW